MCEVVSGEGLFCLAPTSNVDVAHPPTVLNACCVSEERSETLPLSCQHMVLVQGSLRGG